MAISCPIYSMTDATILPDAELPPQTVPSAISFSMRGFASTEDAERMANRIGGYVRLLSRAIDLSALDGVTIAYDYDAALAELDRGVAGLRALSRSNDDQLIGVAMAPAVLRDGEVKVHIVINAAYVEGLDEDEGEDDGEQGDEGGTEERPGERFASALYLLAHECAHVAVTAEKDRMLPGVILQHQITGYEEAVFAQVSEACWEEYAACRLSAPFGVGQLGHYEAGLRGVLGVAAARAAAARERFWEHRDLNRVVSELGPSLAEPLRLASYVLGHIDGRDQPLSMAEATRCAILEAGYDALIEALADTLRTLWAARGKRTAIGDHDVVGDVARDAFWAGGLLIRPGESDEANIYVWEPGEVDPYSLGLTQHWRDT